MKNSPFQQRHPLIDSNSLIRIPQREAYIELVKFATNPNEQEREVGIVLPVGCGKSGCITIAPFAFSSARTLVIAPGLNIAKQLYNDFDPSLSSMFYIKCHILDGQPYPEPVEIRGKTTNLADLEEADVVITNIQQLQRQNNHWLQKLPQDFFDLILFDEGHHSVADSWQTLKTKFPNAKIVNFSATPLRADGQLMAGRILYSFPIYRAIQEGYVKRLKAIVLNPKTLRYVRRADDQEIEVSLNEVRQLGEQDADFRRSIVTSTETLNTIVDASIRELEKLRESTGEKRLKIIASALNYEHCRQIVEAYKARGKAADYVHSIEESAANQKVMDRLENHELDVIVQVRKLGEGFDHPYLSVAAVFSIFANLSPFVQFVGRIMRVIKQNAPSDVLNQGTVIFHAGANVASRWEDFQQYSEADRGYFDALLPMEELVFSSSDELQVEIPPPAFVDNYRCEVRSQSEVHLEEIPLITNDPEALKALQLLKSKGYSREQLHEAYELIPIPVTRVRQRQAKRNSIDTWARTETGRILAEKRLNSQGGDLDKKHLGKTNFVVIKSTIDRHINELVGHKAGERHEFNKQELETIEQNFSAILDAVTKEIFDAED